MFKKTEEISTVIEGESLEEQMIQAYIGVEALDKAMFFCNKKFNEEINFSTIGLKSRAS